MLEKSKNDLESYIIDMQDKLYQVGSKKGRECRTLGVRKFVILKLYRPSMIQLGFDGSINSNHLFIHSLKLCVKIWV